MKLHPVTVVLEGGSRAVGAAVAGFTIGSILGTYPGTGQFIPGIGFLAGIPLALLFAAVAIGYEVAHYRHFTYELTADTLDLESGVFFRRDREIPLARVQNVDISRPIVARILGVAVVNLETAGGGKTEAKLQFVDATEAQRLQDEIQRRKRTASRETEAAVAPEPAELLFELDDRDLVLLSVLSFDPRLLSILFLFVPMVVPNVVPDVDSATRAAMALFAILSVLGSAFALWVLSAAASFVQFYGFRLHRVDDELRYERGLIQRYSGSIPLSKVQALVVDENVLMRRFGFASLSVETAGYAPGSTPSRGSEAAIPLAPLNVLWDLATDIEPFDPPTVNRPPKRARRRYLVRYSLVVAAITALGWALSSVVVQYPWYWLLALFLPVPLAADRKWRHRGWALGDGYAFTRNGFWRRRTHVIPDFRVQTVIERQTVFQRRWSLGSVVVDTASSRGLTSNDATAADIDASEARTLRESIRGRLQGALTERRTAATGD